MGNSSPQFLNPSPTSPAFQMFLRLRASHVARLSLDPNITSSGLFLSAAVYSSLKQHKHW